MKHHNEDSIMKPLTNKLKTLIMVPAFLLTMTAFSAPVMAGTNSPGIDNKQDNQKGRIVQGIKSGELTAQETRRLGKQQGKTYRKEYRFKADGDFTPRERAVIHRDLLKSSKSIYVQKHDRQVQGMGRPGLRSPGINKRQVNQRKRIGQGIRSGELTRGEAARLGHQQVRIHRQERRFKSDGTFTKRERVRVHKKQNRASKNIYRKKHNARTR
jgi:hypothetical protein